MAEVEEAQEVVAEAAETVADVSRSLSGRDIRLVLASAGAGLLLGGAIGAFIAERRLRTKYDELAESEINLMREHFKAKTRAREAEELKPTLDELKGVVEEAGYTPDPTGEPNTAPSKTETVVREVREKAERKAETQRDDGPAAEMPGLKDAVEAAKIHRNIFQDHGELDEWDYTKEIPNRREDTPYVIHVDEQGETGYSTNNLTYYADDDIVADDQEHIIQSPEEIIGPDFRDKFGHGSGDPNLLYVRNEELAAEYEVVISHEDFAEAVHGIVKDDDDELTHMMHRRRPPHDDG